MSSNKTPDNLDNLMKEMGEKIVKGIYISVMTDEVYDTEPLENWLKAKLLTWHETEKQKYSIVYADKIIGLDEDDRYFADDLQINIVQGFDEAVENGSRNELRSEQRELNKSKGGKI